MLLRKPDIQILVVDDEANIRRAVQLSLENEGYRVHVAESAIAAFQQLSSQGYDLAVLDVRLGEITGIELFQKMMENGIPTPVVFISGNASLAEAAQAVKLGAFDFIEKPFTSEKLCITVQRCLEHEALKRAVKDLGEQAGTTIFIGKTRATEKILQDVSKVAGTAVTVLIHGESGTGKELIAKLIHEQSGRGAKPFVRVNCSAIPETLIESELFGFEKGAFTGAAFAKRGYFEQANHGTLFLDEIGDMSLAAQAKVLRAIQSSEIQKVGSEKTVQVHVRLIAATNKDLAAEVKAGRFREDLYYRINVVPIRTVPLRERPDDIGLLAEWFVARYCERNGFRTKTIDPAVIAEFEKYDWPGNVRELQNLVERLVIMGGDPIRLSDVPPHVLDKEAAKPGPCEGLTLREFRERSERDYLVSALRKTNGSISKASELLGIDRTNLHKKIAQYGIQKKEYFA